MAGDGKREKARARGASAVEPRELLAIVDAERELSRRAWLGAVGRVFLAGAAYEVASLGLVGCGAYRDAFRAEQGRAWEFARLGDVGRAEWADLRLGVTTVEQLAGLRFEGEVFAEPELGRIELVPAVRAGAPDVPQRIALVFRDVDEAGASLDDDAVLARVELDFGQGPAVREAARAAFGPGEELFYGTQGYAVREVLLYRDRQLLCTVDDPGRAELVAVLFEPSLLYPLVDEMRLCTIQCTWCTEACTGCTEQCTLPCTAQCTGCTAGCTSGCTSNCTMCTSCTSGCTAGCTFGCTGTCTSCTGSCTMGCTSCTSCTSMTSCYSDTSCSYCTGCTSCTSGCTFGCTGFCTSCTGACTSGCTTCTWGCTGCTDCTSCTGGCEVCTSCTAPCTTCTSCTSCTSGCTQRTGGFDGR
ncbi:MAG: hypothetical protein HY905_01775 [Deltaproteobacteria bacterium]|nr:hypothetical protein [Deltaproteobacteria bacterium]